MGAGSTGKALALCLLYSRGQPRAGGAGCGESWTSPCKQEEAAGTELAEMSRFWFLGSVQSPHPYWMPSALLRKWSTVEVGVGADLKYSLALTVGVFVPAAL